jgi:sigma-B regulation protein RsbU (phosphoserine phosphatase)
MKAPSPKVTLLHRYQHLIEISRDLASTLDLDTLLSNIVSVAAELSDAEASSILLLDETNQQLYFQTSTNMHDLPIMRGMVIPSEGSLAGWVVKNRLPVIVNDVKNDQRHMQTSINKSAFGLHL